MKFNRTALCLTLGLSSVAGEVLWRNERHLVARQDNAPLPTLGQSSASNSAKPTNSAAESGTTTQTNTPTISATSSTSRNDNSTSTISSTIADVITSTVSSLNPTNAPVTNGTDKNDDSHGIQLPLQPTITPALSIAGVILILAGIVYAVIGLKNQWVHVFLSTAFLASLATLVLIVYVINPPVSNAIQGAYFVGVFLAGVILGGGALVFKEVTEGLGCLLGGYCLAMWFLTLKEGGLITNPAGKGIFIGIWCVLCWSLSFSHYTRSYALIGSTSFSGSTAFVLGIDCFSRSGLKEFWVYLWDLNDKIFPLYTETYPITRGTRVETIVIVLGAIIGVISQIKLWKIVRDKQKAREAAIEEDKRREEAVEEALGRHIERQNDRDRSAWEKQYGNRLEAKRNTILWTEAHGESKRFSSGSTTEVNSDSSDSVELSSLPQTNTKTAFNSRNKRQSNMTVHPIQEVDEDEDAIRPVLQRLNNRKSFLVDGSDLMPSISVERLDLDDFSSFHSHNANQADEKTLAKLESKSSPRLDPMQSLRPGSDKPQSKKIASRLRESESDPKLSKRNSIPTFKELKRRSLQSLSGKSPPMLSSAERSPQPEAFGESQEALVTTGSLRTASRASSLAATLDEENEKMDDLALIDSHQSIHRPPTIVVSPVLGANFINYLGMPPSPGAHSDDFDQDPEELVRRQNTYSAFVDGTGRPAPAPVDPNSSSNADTLTKDALTQIPSQMSNVVMSYRTNEWAKHIAAAEAPVYEEPEPIAQEEELEAPTHLASPTSPALPSPIDTAPKPPPLPSPVTSTTPSEFGVKVNPEVQPIHSRPVSEQVEELAPSNRLSQQITTSQSAVAQPMRALSQISSTLPPTLPVRTPSQTSLQQPYIIQPQRTLSQTSLPRSQTDPNLYLQRNASRISLSRGIPTIDEQAVMYAPNRVSSSTIGYQEYQPSALPQSYSQPLIATAGRSHHDLTRSDSQPLITNMSAMRSETRLRDFSQSHQPLQRNNTNESHRENLMANWRNQLSHNHTQNIIPAANVQTRYVQHMQDFEADKQRREAERMSRAQSQAFIDQSMRTQGMIDAHKEVLRKMQSQANKKLTK